MAISKEERRFLRSWEEQRQDGKRSFVLTYTIGLFILYFMIGVAIGLFSGLPFIKVWLLLGWGLSSLLLAFISSFLYWRQKEKKFTQIIQREMKAGQ